LKLIIYALLIFITQFTYATDPQPDDLKVVNDYVNKKISELSAAESYTKFMLGDLNSDGVDDIAMLHTMVGIGGMGGNNTSQRLVVFKKTSDGLKYVNEAIAGSRGSRFLSFESINNGVITFNSKFYLPLDARCCPTGKGKVFYKLTRNIVRELNVAPRS